MMFGDCKKNHHANRHTLKYNVYINFGLEAFKLVYSSSIKKKRNHILRGILRVHIDENFCSAVIVNSRSANKAIQAAGRKWGLRSL